MAYISYGLNMNLKEKSVNHSISVKVHSINFQVTENDDNSFKNNFGLELIFLKNVAFIAS